jgi:hypothetical protein
MTREVGFKCVHAVRVYGEERWLIMSVAFLAAMKMGLWTGRKVGEEKTQL